METLETKSLLSSLYLPRKRWRSGQKGGISLFEKKGNTVQFGWHRSP
jgi:hypothetical protein